MIRILPRPQHIEEREGRLLLDYHCRITMDSSFPSEVFFYASQLAEQLKKSSGIELLIDRRASGAHKGIVLCMSEEAGITRENKKEKEAYRLEITPEGVTVCAAEKEGLFNGVQTLRQLIIQYGSSLPCLYIEDYPELSVRGWFMDVTRGRIPKMAYLKELADRCSLYKINQLHLYIEHTFLFDGLSEVWRDDTPLTAQDILEFDAYCAERNIELVPSVATFGHLYKVLRTKTFHELSEVEEAEGTAFSFYERMCHHTLNSTDDRAYELVCRLIDEYSPLFRSNLFNINCDETFDLGRGRGKERADEIGSHVMYVQWVNRVCEHVKALGKRPMFWGDIIAAHPEAIKELPEDVICMTWDYSPTPREINVKKLWENGAHQYLCPGVQGWNQTIHLLEIAYENIKKMAVFAHQFDGEGLLTTDWGDYGHFQYPELALVGIIYGAAFGWNRVIPEREEINADISVIEYGDASATLIETLSHMSDQAVIHWGEFVQFSETYRYHIAGKDMEAFWKGYLPRIEKSLPHIDACNETIKSDMEKVAALLPHIEADKRKSISPILHMAEGQIILNTILQVLDKEYLGHQDAYTGDPRQLAEALEIWYYEYRRQWHKISRESELYRIGELIFWAADFLRILGA